MLDKDKCRAGIVGPVLKELLEGFQAAGGGADRDNRASRLFFSQWSRSRIGPGSNAVLRRFFLGWFFSIFLDLNS